MTYLVIFNNKWKRILAEKSSLSVYKIRKKVYNRNSFRVIHEKKNTGIIDMANGIVDVLSA